MWSKGQGYEGLSLLIGSEAGGVRVKGQRRCKHNGDDAGVERWKRRSKCDGVIREVKGKEIGSPDYSRNNY